MKPKKAILAYLYCLNDKATLDKLSSEELDIGRDNLMGCLVKLSEYIEHLIESGQSNPFDELVLELIKLREKINGFEHELEDGKSLLSECTKLCSNTVYSYLRS